MTIYFFSTTQGLVAPGHIEAVISAPNKITICLVSGRELVFTGREAKNIYNYLTTYSYANMSDPHRPPSDDPGIFYSKPGEGGEDV